MGRGRRGCDRFAQTCEVAKADPIRRIRTIRGRNDLAIGQIERGVGGFTESTRIIIQIDQGKSANSVRSAVYDPARSQPKRRWASSGLGGSGSSLAEVSASTSSWPV